MFREWSGADFPKPLCYIDFGKSYLIPFTPNFDIGEGIESNNKLLMLFGVQSFSFELFFSSLKLWIPKSELIME
jgi:hypothetical protein